MTTLRSTRPPRARRVSQPLRREAALLLLSFGLVGCYTYTPVEFGAAGRGASIRAELSPAGEQDVTGRFGPGVRELRGRVLETEDDGVAVLVDAIVGRQRVVAVDAAAVRLTRDHVGTVHERRLSASRSALFGAGIVAAVIVLTENLGGMQRTPDNGGETPAARRARLVLRGGAAPASR